MIPTILILADACRASGALTIYRQFAEWLGQCGGGARWTVVVDPSMPQPELPNVTYVTNGDHSWGAKFRLVRNGYQRIIDELGIEPSVVVSLQNVGIRTALPQIIYYHQPLPLFDYQWNPLRATQRTYWIYTHVYPRLVRYSTNDKTEFVVQIPFIKDRLAEKLRIDAARIHTQFPDVEKIDTAAVAEWEFEKGTVNLLYPAVGHPYKNHSLLVNTFRLLKQGDGELARRIRVQFTLDADLNKPLVKKISECGLSDNFVFHSVIPHSDLLRYYKGADGLLFPSEIETLGLPLIEAVYFGKPIVAADFDYARQVLDGYEGAAYASPKQPHEWAAKIKELCAQAQFQAHSQALAQSQAQSQAPAHARAFQPLRQAASTWPAFFDLIFRTASATEMWGSERLIINALNCVINIRAGIAPAERRLAA